jgi:hypothetical protein
MIAELILWLYAQGWEVTLGDAWARDGHRENSLHYIRLAVDLNLFIDGEYQTTTAAHRPIGEQWELMGGSWGGRFGDGNHYSLEHEGRQ